MQIAESVRIQLCGNVLNSSGVYKRCKLTRLFLYEQCDVPIKGRDTKQTILKPLVAEYWTMWEQKRELRDSVLGWVVDIIRVAVEEGMEKELLLSGKLVEEPSKEYEKRDEHRGATKLEKKKKGRPKKRIEPPKDCRKMTEFLSTRKLWVLDQKTIVNNDTDVNDEMK